MENYNLENEFARIQELCFIAREEYGSRATYFGRGITLKELNDWEKRNDIIIPDSYKEWLQLTGQCMLLFDLVVLTMPEVNFDIVHNQDLALIGRVIGDGEYLCFSKSTHGFFRYKNAVQRSYGDFKQFLNETIIRLLENSLENTENVQQGKDVYHKLESKSIEVKTRAFNSLEVEERKKYLDHLKSFSGNIYNNFLDDIRRQAILDFWQNERELIGKGRCKRKWNPSQIEHILNISTETGMSAKQAGRP